MTRFTFNDIDIMKEYIKRALDDGKLIIKGDNAIFDNGAVMGACNPKTLAEDLIKRQMAFCGARYLDELYGNS